VIGGNVSPGPIQKSVPSHATSTGGMTTVDIVLISLISIAIIALIVCCLYHSKWVSGSQRVAEEDESFEMTNIQHRPNIPSGRPSSLKLVSHQEPVAIELDT
jgi:hypothetical protein